MVSPRQSPKRRPLHERSQSENNEANLNSTLRIGEGSQGGASSVFPSQLSHILRPNPGSHFTVSENDYDVSDYFRDPASLPKGDTGGSWSKGENGWVYNKTRSKSPPRSAAAQRLRNRGSTKGPRRKGVGSFSSSTRTDPDSVHTSLSRPDSGSSAIRPLRTQASNTSQRLAAANTLRRKESTVNSLGIVSSANDSTASFVRRTQATQPELAQWLAYAESPKFDELLSRTSSTASPAGPLSRRASRDSQHAHRPKRRVSLSGYRPPSQHNLSRRSSSVSAAPPVPILKPSVESNQRYEEPQALEGSFRAEIVPSTHVQERQLSYAHVKPARVLSSQAETSIETPQAVHYTAGDKSPTRNAPSGLPSLDGEKNGKTRNALMLDSADFSLAGQDQSYSAVGIKRKPHARRHSTIRIVSEEDQQGDEAGPPRWPTARRTTGATRAPEPENESGRADSMSSVIVHSIPPWARYFHRKSSSEQMAMTYARPDTQGTTRGQSRGQVGSSRGPSRPAPSSSQSSEAAPRERLPTMSPDPERFADEIYMPRVRPHPDGFEGRSGSSTTGKTQSDNDEGHGPPPGTVLKGPPRRRTTHIWSPQLRHDKRASTISFWDAPRLETERSVGDSIFLSRRSLQMTLFCIGFIFPFAWFVGAFLPLPQKPRDLGKKRASQVDPEIANEFFYQTARYESAVWWRNLNRAMSVVGLLILGAITALVVVATK